MIGQSGGPTAVINQSLVGAVLEARRQPLIEKIYGARHGVQGILNRDYIDLTREPRELLEAIARTPAAALGSVRLKPNEAECRRIFENLRSLGARYFFYIGGNDSAETAWTIEQAAMRERHELHVFHIPKTIDNDLRGSDHTPGYGSAARFVAEAFIGQELDNRSLPGVNIIVVMGRDAGFLTAASVLGKVRSDSGPHLVYVPERPFDPERYVADVKRSLERYGRCLVAVSEGLREADGEPIALRLSKGSTDEFGNLQLSGSGALGDYLTGYLKANLRVPRRLRTDTLGYLQRSFVGVVSEVDAAEARAVGREAVRMATGGYLSGSVAIVRAPGNRYRIKYERLALTQVAGHTRHMPLAFINRAGNGTTPAFERYAGPIVGPLPEPAFLAGR